ncbi:MAG: Spy/CpxP family protein refolding chaperone [Gammaproteobacteria bacterium]|nr:Spy/CpxP family protein refolding chaperone [Gammaproteobacteria bacterium]
MNTKTTTPILTIYLLFITLLFSLTISPANAYDSENIQYGHMDSGHMGYGNMGMMGMGHMGSGNIGMMGNNYMYMLDLSDSQRKSIRDIQKETRTQQLALHDKLTEHADDLYSLYKEDKPNAKKIGSIYKSIFDLKRQKIELSITTKNKVYDLLTKEQKEKLKEWKSSRMGYGMFRNQQGQGMRHMMQ